ncbi:MAG TPA: S8 family serine peptidase [Chthoniobacterales bacterium]|nr:S8 family serine peptidase [Chthoniobacterales bacterium]
MKSNCKAIVCFYFLFVSAAFCAEPAQNLDSGLFVLSEHAKLSVPEAGATGAHSQMAQVSDADKELIRGRFDDQDRVLVHVLLDGRSSLDQVAQQVESLQGVVLGRNATYRHGILAAYIPTDQLDNAASIVGVRALTMEHEPVKRAGKYSSQSREVLHTDVLNQQGLTGQGMTIGVLSDSFNTARFAKHGPRTTAEQDEKEGYLPVVNVIQDSGGPGQPGTDEGRAICLIAYAEAPGCNEAFATANPSEVNFANNIVRLRAEANCDVIDDDVGYYDEPVFSDGIVSQAVDEVVTSTILPGKKVIYTSSAGNDGNNGYRSAYRELTDADVRAKGNHGNLKLDVTDKSSPHYLDPVLTAGGWHNWNPNGGSEPVTTIVVPGSKFRYNLFLQWDDLFDQGNGITADYNFLVFDANGNFLRDLSGTRNAFKTQQPFKYTHGLTLGTAYQIAFTKTTQTDPLAPPAPATHQLAMYTSLDGLSIITGTYFQSAPLNVPIIYGHPAAASAIAVAAYDFNWKPTPPYKTEIENYTTPGPAYIYFDRSGARLTKPKLRLKPEVAGVDGVITTSFFSPGYYNYPFAFFGTSASAPTVAGVVALMLQAAGGPLSLDADQVRSVLENTALPRRGFDETTSAKGSSSQSNISVIALGSFYFGPTYLTISYSGPSNESVDTVIIDGAKAGLVFDTTPKSFVVGTVNGFNVSDVTMEPASSATQAFTLKFKKGAFANGGSISFTIGQDEIGTFKGLTQSQSGVGVDALDLADGGTFTAQVSGNSNQTITGAFDTGPTTHTYQQGDGFGLIDAISAVSAVKK